MAKKNGAPSTLGNAPTPDSILPITQTIQKLLSPEGQLAASDVPVVTTAANALEIIDRVAELERSYLARLGELAGVRGGRNLLIDMLTEAQNEIVDLDHEVEMLKASRTPLTNRVMLHQALQSRRVQWAPEQTRGKWTFSRTSKGSGGACITPKRSNAAARS